jgi:hypothetical protein
MKTTIWTYVIDNGDGSYSVALFATQEEAEEYMRIENENHYATESLSSHVLELDEKGILQNPDTNELWSEDV